MSDSDFIDVPSPSSSSHILSPTIPMSTASLDQPQINDIDGARIIIDRVPTPVNVGTSLGGDPLGVEMNENIDGADRAESSLPDGGSLQAMLELDSFLPVVQALGSTLFSGVLASPGDHYYFRGTPSDAEIMQLESLVHKVDAFRLTKSSHQHIPIAMMLRLVRIRRWGGPFFPALKSLRVTDANPDTMSFLDLFYSPTLESFELTDFDSWSNSCINDLQLFIHNLPLEAPNLSLIKVLFGRPTLQMATSWLDFAHLRELHLSNVAIVDWQLLFNLSKLSSLRILNLNLAVPKIYNRQFSQASRGLGDWDVIVDSPEREPPTGFRRLAILRVNAVVEILDDLVGMVASSSLQELDMGLLAYCDPPPGYMNPIRKRAFMQSETHFTPRNEDSYFFLLLTKVLRQCSTVQRISLNLSEESIERDKPGQPPRDHFISPTTFEDLLHADIEHLTVEGWKFDFSIPETMEAAGKNTHLRLLSFPVDPRAHCSAASPGFPLRMLSSIAHLFPNLLSFQGYAARHISGLPNFLPVNSAPNNPSHHTLRTLSLGDGQLHWGSEDEYYSLRVAFYLHQLFPNLQNIVAGDGEAGKDWRFIERAVKMCQACRASS